MADIDPSYKTLVGNVGQTGMGQGDLVRAVYDLYLAVCAICNNIDEDSGNTGTDYLSYIGTPLETAMAKLKTPSGPVNT